MNKKAKRLISLLLAIAMILTTVGPAFAEGIQEEEILNPESQELITEEKEETALEEDLEAEVEPVVKEEEEEIKEILDILDEEKEEPAAEEPKAEEPLEEELEEEPEEVKEQPKKMMLGASLGASQTSTVVYQGYGESITLSALDLATWLDTNGAGTSGKKYVYFAGTAVRLNNSVTKNSFTLEDNQTYSVTAGSSLVIVSKVGDVTYKDIRASWTIQTNLEYSTNFYSTPISTIISNVVESIKSGDTSWSDSKYSDLKLALVSDGTEITSQNWAAVSASGEVSVKVYFKGDEGNKPFESEAITLKDNRATLTAHPADGCTYSYNTKKVSKAEILAAIFKNVETPLTTSVAGVDPVDVRELSLWYNGTEISGSDIDSPFNDASSVTVELRYPGDANIKAYSQKITLLLSDNRQTIDLSNALKDGSYKCYYTLGTFLVHNVITPLHPLWNAVATGNIPDYIILAENAILQFDADGKGSWTDISESGTNFCVKDSWNEKATETVRLVFNGDEKYRPASSNAVEVSISSKLVTKTETAKLTLKQTDYTYLINPKDLPNDDDVKAALFEALVNKGSSVPTDLTVNDVNINLGSGFTTPSNTAKKVTIQLQALVRGDEDNAVYYSLNILNQNTYKKTANVTVVDSRDAIRLDNAATIEIQQNLNWNDDDYRVAALNAITVSHKAYGDEEYSALGKASDYTSKISFDKAINHSKLDENQTIHVTFADDKDYQGYEKDITVKITSLPHYTVNADGNNAAISLPNCDNNGFRYISDSEEGFVLNVTPAAGYYLASATDVTAAKADGTPIELSLAEGSQGKTTGTITFTVEDGVLAAGEVCNITVTCKKASLALQGGTFYLAWESDADRAVQLVNAMYSSSQPLNKDELLALINSANPASEDYTGKALEDVIDIEFDASFTRSNNVWKSLDYKKDSFSEATYHEFGESITGFIFNRERVRIRYAFNGGWTDWAVATIQYKSVEHYKVDVNITNGSGPDDFNVGFDISGEGESATELAKGFSVTATPNDGYYIQSAKVTKKQSNVILNKTTADFSNVDKAQTITISADQLTDIAAKETVKVDIVFAKASFGIYSSTEVLDNVSGTDLVNELYSELAPKTNITGLADPDKADITIQYKVGNTFYKIGDAQASRAFGVNSPSGKETVKFVWKFNNANIDSSNTAEVTIVDHRYIPTIVVDTTKVAGNINVSYSDGILTLQEKANQDASYYKDLANSVLSLQYPAETSISGTITVDGNVNVANFENTQSLTASFAGDATYQPASLNLTIKINPLDRYTVKVNDPSHGTVKIGTGYEKTKVVLCEQAVEINFAPASRYYLSEVKLNGSSVLLTDVSNGKLTLAANKYENNDTVEIVATFSEAKVTLANKTGTVKDNWNTTNDLRAQILKAVGTITTAPAKNENDLIVRYQPALQSSYKELDGSFPKTKGSVVSVSISFMLGDERIYDTATITIEDHRPYLNVAYKTSPAFPYFEGMDVTDAAVLEALIDPDGTSDKNLLECLNNVTVEYYAANAGNLEAGWQPLNADVSKLLEWAAHEFGSHTTEKIRVTYKEDSDYRKTVWEKNLTITDKEHYVLSTESNSILLGSITTTSKKNIALGKGFTFTVTPYTGNYISAVTVGVSGKDPILSQTTFDNCEAATTITITDEKAAAIANGDTCVAKVTFAQGSITLTNTTTGTVNDNWTDVADLRDQILEAVGPITTAPTHSNDDLTVHYQKTPGVFGDLDSNFSHKPGETETVSISFTCNGKTIYDTATITIKDHRTPCEITFVDSPEYKFYEGRTPDSEELYEAIIKETLPADMSLAKGATIEYCKYSITDVDNLVKLINTTYHLSLKPEDLDFLWAEIGSDITKPATWDSKSIWAAIIDAELEKFGKAHTFGEGFAAAELAGKPYQELVRVKFDGDKDYRPGANSTLVTLKDLRIATKIKYNCDISYNVKIPEKDIVIGGKKITLGGQKFADDVDLIVYGSNLKDHVLGKTYKDVTKLNIVEDKKDGEAVAYANDEITINPTELSVKLFQEQPVAIYFAGNDTYKPCLATVDFYVLQAASDLDIKSDIKEYDENAYDLTQLVSNRYPSDLDYLMYAVGVDGDANGFVSVYIPDSVKNSLQVTKADMAQDVLDSIKTTDPFSTLVKKALGEYIKSAAAQEIAFDGYEALQASLNQDVKLGDLPEVVNTVCTMMGKKAPDSELLTAIQAQLDDLYEKYPALNRGLSIRIGEGPVNAGVYVVGAVSTDMNYQLAIGLGGLEIKQAASEISFKQDLPESHILTWTQAKEENFDFGITYKIGEKEITSDQPEYKYVKNVYSGIEADLEIDLGSTAPRVPGVYNQTAFTLGGNYIAEPKTRTYTILPQTVTITADYSSNYTYDTTPHGVTPHVTAEDGTDLTESSHTSVVYTGVGNLYNSTKAPTDAGTYVATVTYDGILDELRETRFEMFTFTIDPVHVSFEWITPLPESHILTWTQAKEENFDFGFKYYADGKQIDTTSDYDGLKHLSLTFVGETAALVPYASDIAARYPGVYTETLTSTSTNYIAVPISRIYTVAPQTVNIEAKDLTVTYDGKPHAIVPTVTAEDEKPVIEDLVSVVYEGINGTVYLASTTAPTNAGTYKAIVTYNGLLDPERTTVSKTYTLVIEKQGLNVEFVKPIAGPLNYVDAQSFEFGFKINNVQWSNEQNAAYGVFSSFAGKLEDALDVASPLPIRNVGSYVQVVYCINPNYYIIGGPYISRTYEIKRVPTEIIGADVFAGLYDGNVHQYNKAKVVVDDIEGHPCDKKIDYYYVLANTVNNLADIMKYDDVNNVVEYFMDRAGVSTEGIKDSGEYYVLAVYKGNNTYAPSFNVFMMSLGRADATVAFGKSEYTATYTGEKCEVKDASVTLIGKEKFSDTIHYTYYTSYDAGVLSGKLDSAPTNVGVYYVQASIGQYHSYNAAVSEPVKLTVFPRLSIVDEFGSTIGKGEVFKEITIEDLTGEYELTKEDIEGLKDGYYQVKVEFGFKTDLYLLEIKTGEIEIAEPVDLPANVYVDVKSDVPVVVRSLDEVAKNFAEEKGTFDELDFVLNVKSAAPAEEKKAVFTVLEKDAEAKYYSMDIKEIINKDKEHPVLLADTEPVVLEIILPIEVTIPDGKMLTVERLHGEDNKLTRFTQVSDDKNPKDGTFMIVEDANGKNQVVIFTSQFSLYRISYVNKPVYYYAPKTGCKRDDSCPLAKFTDVDQKTAWYHDAAHYCVENGLMVGISDTLFAPQGNTSRAMMMTILARMNDVDTNGGEKWFTKGLEWAMNVGVSDGTNPESFITREQFAAMLYRYANLIKYDTSKDTADTNTLSFDDIFSVSAWANEGVHWCIAAGILEGRTDDGINCYIAPKELLTRAEASAMIYRFCKTIEE